MRLLRVIIPLAMGAAACGGGGGGTPMVALDGGNGVPIAAQAYSSAQLAGAMVVMVEGFGDVLDGGTAPSCGTGSVDVVVDDAVPKDVVSAGDSVSVSFHGCTAEIDGETVTLDGSMVLDVTEALDPGNATFDITFRRLAMLSSAGTVTLDGGLTVSVATAGSMTETAVAGDLSVVAESGGDVVTLKLRDFRSEEAYDGATGDYSRTFSGTYASSAIGGAVELETMAPLEGNGDGPPGAGEFAMHGAGGSEVRVVAIGGPGVRVFIDANGDGTPENTVDTTWNDLG